MSNQIKAVEAGSGGAVDLTPLSAANWRTDGGPVLVVNQAATIHQRIALAWGMSQELETLAELAVGAPVQTTALCDVLHEKAVLLQVLLYDLAAQTADQDAKGGAHEHHPL